MTRYEGDFDFVTIRGAGHMVPTNKPVATFAFMKAWISDEEYLSFHANCTQGTLLPLLAGTVAEQQEIAATAAMLRG